MTKDLLVVSLLSIVAAATLGPSNAMSKEGYIIDKLCIDNCRGKDADDVTCAPDGINVFYSPGEHTGSCLRMKRCENSTYSLLSSLPTDMETGIHDILLDLAGSQDTVVSYIQNGSKGAFPKVIVEYDESTAAITADGVLNVVGATILDPWDVGSDLHYENIFKDIYQVLCSDSASASIEKNNYCFRSDVEVTDRGDMLVIESNGCPGHKNMLGGSGLVDNPQDSDCGAECGACGTKPDCGACGTKPDCGACGTKPDCGACGTKPDCGACGTKPDCGACGTTPGCGTCGLTPPEGTAGFTRQLECGCGSKCNGQCYGCGSKCNGQCCGCGSKCSGQCCGCKSKCNGQCSSSIYTPYYHHYTMVIPAAPGTPGDDVKKIPNDVVGMLSNGVLLDNHQQTWSYDSCNGHSGTNGQYHYHIPPSCLLKEMGMDYADNNTWWMDDGKVRAYNDMASQFPPTGSSSPVIGRALDGFPIYALYDDAGVLQRGAMYGGELDECNGKLDSSGNYGYYITADPPFAPPCLKGVDIGYFTFHKTAKTCPDSGFSTTYYSCPDQDPVTFEDIQGCIIMQSSSPTSGPTSSPTSGPTSSPVSGDSSVNPSKDFAAFVAATGAAVLLL